MLATASCFPFCDVVRAFSLLLGVEIQLNTTDSARRVCGASESVIAAASAGGGLELAASVFFGGGLLTSAAGRSLYGTACGSFSQLNSMRHVALQCAFLESVGLS
jgi:hypothetical protein